MTERVLVLAIALLGCKSPVEVHPDEQGRVLGTLEHYGDGVRLDMPESIPAGEEFSVTVSTYGGGCTVKGETEVVQRSRGAIIRPYDYEPTGRRLCTAILRIIPHEAVLKFEARGLAEITIVGKRRPDNRLVTISRTVTVQ